MTTFVVYSQDKNGGELIEVVVLQDGDSHLVDEVFEKIKAGDFVVLTGSRNDEGTYFLKAFAKEEVRAGAFCGFSSEKEYREYHKKLAIDKKAKGFVLAKNLDGLEFWERKEDCRFFNGKWYPVVDYLCLMLGESTVNKSMWEFSKKGMVIKGGIRFDSGGYKKLLEELEAKILF